MHSVTKLCADYLRAIATNHGVKLKSGHAHELAVAFFGYTSKAAMLADTLSPESNFSQVQTLVLMPSKFIAERQRCLDGLSADLPDIYILGEEMFVKLISEGNFSFRSFASWTHLAEVLTTEYLQDQGDILLPLNFGLYEKARHIFSKPQYEFPPKIDVTNEGINLTVTNRYNGSQDVNFKAVDVMLSIKLQRVAGHVGFSKPDISIIDVSNHSIKRSVGI